MTHLCQLIGAGCAKALQFDGLTEDRKPVFVPRIS
jgi:hypothetical protein